MKDITVTQSELDLPVCSKCGPIDLADSEILEHIAFHEQRDDDPTTLGSRSRPSHRAPS